MDVKKKVLEVVLLHRNIMRGHLNSHFAVTSISLLDEYAGYELLLSHLYLIRNFFSVSNFSLIFIVSFLFLLRVSTLMCSSFCNI